MLAVLVHVVGSMLLLNSLTTYGLRELLFPKCTAGGWLSTSCSSYPDPCLRRFATELHDWQTSI
jgi:hypothetical protein